MADRERNFLRAAVVSVVCTMSAASFACAVAMNHLPVGIRMSMMFFALCCMGILLVLYLYRPGSSPRLWTRVGRDELSVIIEPKVVGRPKREKIAIAPTIREMPDPALSDQRVRYVIEECYRIVSGDKEDGNPYREAANLLASEPEILQKSWKASANLARFTAMYGDFDLAREYAEGLLERFGQVPDAVGSYHDLMYMCLASRTPKGPGALRSELLMERKGHVEMGLKSAPGRIGLMLDGVEISLSLGESDAAVGYLKRAIKADSTSARKRLQSAVDGDEDFRALIMQDRQMIEILRSNGVVIQEKPHDKREVVE